MKDRLELRAKKDYEKLSKDIKELFKEKEYIELVEEKYNQMKGE